MVAETIQREPHMKIVALEAQDFRSLHDIRWEPGDLNVLIGPNGSGKTNLVLLLKLIAQSAHGKLAESVTRLGGIMPLLWDRRADGFVFNLQTTTGEGRTKGTGLDLTYKCRIVPKGRERFYEVNVERLHGMHAHNGKRRPAGEFDFLVRRGPFAQIISKKATWIKPDSDTIPAEETLLSLFGRSIGPNPTLASFR